MSAAAESGYGLIANVVWDRVLRMGAKVYLLGHHGDYECIYVFGLSKGGRSVRKYLPMKRLHHIRAAWFPPHIWAMAWLQPRSKAEAQLRATRMAAYWEGVRFATTEGLVLQEGLSVAEAAARWGMRREQYEEPMP